MVCGVKKLSPRNENVAYVFLIPLLFGIVFMFALPLLTSLRYSLSNVTLDSGGAKASFNGFKNYYDALFAETQFRQEVVNSALNMLLNVPLITFVAFFFANLLNQKFVGRGAFRVIFLLPLVLASPAMMNFDAGDALHNMMGAAGSNFKDSQSLSVSSSSLNELLLMSGVLPKNVIDYLIEAMNRIYEILVLSGVQMLIFLAALQSIPKSVYEAVKIEGASAWEEFWKITFPMISPMLLLSVIYTVIDSFTMSGNRTLKIIQDMSFMSQKFGLSAAMSWIYFVLILVIIGLISLLWRVKLRHE